MKIAIIKHSVTISPTGGVKVQAEMWKKGLESKGHQVTLINIWDTNDWKAFDVIIILEHEGNMLGYVKYIAPANPNIVLAPIIDTLESPRIITVKSKYKLIHKLFSMFHRGYALNNIVDTKQLIKGYLVRSEYEKKYLLSLGISQDRIFNVPLNYRVIPPREMPQKENFVFLACLLADKRKNVERLIKAAKKYKFHLMLAGALRNDSEKKWLYDLKGDSSNIEYLGRVSDEELFNLYRRAKVFALPSINEGVGMVALEAATFGCEIVLTNTGAPKSYYNGMAQLVNPYSIDSIGRAILKVLNGEYSSQPNLRDYIINNYNESHCMDLLEKSLLEILK